MENNVVFGPTVPLVGVSQIQKPVLSVRHSLPYTVHTAYTATYIHTDEEDNVSISPFICSIHSSQASWEALPEVGDQCWTSRHQ